MRLDDSRLRSFTVQRSSSGAADVDSGLAIPGTLTTFEVEMDLQEDGRIVPGLDQQQGRYVAWTYELTLAPGDKLPSTPHGALEVVSSYSWLDEEPTHAEVRLRAL